MLLVESNNQSNRDPPPMKKLTEETQECRVLPIFALLLRFCLAFVSRPVLCKSIQFVQLHRY
jgi:hypothetical protein